MALIDHPLASLPDLDRVLAAVEPSGLLIFKHSTACPISGAAYLQFQKFSAVRRDGIPRTALVRVIEERPISKEIEARLLVKHESPQAIFVTSEGVRGSLSHGAITAESLTQLVS